MDPTRTTYRLTGAGFSSTTYPPTVPAWLRPHMPPGWAPPHLPTSSHSQKLTDVPVRLSPASARLAVSSIHTWLAYIQRQGEETVRAAAPIVS